MVSTVAMLLVAASIVPCQGGYCDAAACTRTTQPGYSAPCPVPECPPEETWVTKKEYRWDCVSQGYICDDPCMSHEYIDVDEYICVECPIHFWEEVGSVWCMICPANPDAGEEWTLPVPFR